MLCEPFDRGRFHRLVRRLTAPVAAGNTDGVVPVPNGWSEPMPWETDDDSPIVPVLVIDDTTTAARCLWSPEQDGSERP